MEPRGRHAKRLIHARNVAELVVKIANIEQARMRLQQRAEDGALGEVVSVIGLAHTNMCSCYSIRACKALSI